MPFDVGTRLGKYEIVSFIDAGGMGEVYRARDTDLKHEVAIKVLAETFARDAERVARFEREARMLAQMNDSNIASLHDLKREQDRIYLVLELVLGGTLAERLDEGPLPLRDALGVFRQIALALEAAHSKGVVHRDLKPQNVKITPEGVVKVLDFGLAKEIFESPSEPQSKTRTGPQDLSREGMVIGTVAYMSPEQARGQPVDKRTDVWSFGCCLFEALSGVRPYRGDGNWEVLEAVKKKEPDYDALPRDVPPEVKKLLRRCLQKEPRHRLRDIADARFVLEEAIESPPAQLRERPVGISFVWTAALIGLAFAAGILVKSLFSVDPDTAVEQVYRFTLDLPPTEPMVLDTGPALSLSADGANLVYTVQRGDQTELRRRSMDQLEPIRLVGTEGAVGPFFGSSADGVGFFAKSQLYRMSLSDSSPVRLGESPSPRGASWVGDQIVFSPRTESGLSLTSPRGASPTVLTELKGERSHRWPWILPDGKHVLFTSWTSEGFDIERLNLQTREREPLVKDGSYARLVPTGHLLFVRDSALMAQAFDEDELDVVGREPTKVVEDIHVDSLTGAAFYDVSPDGTLVYAPREEESEESYGRLLTLRRDGAARLLNPVSRAYQVPRLSPNGKNVLTILTERGSTDVWTMELGRAAMRRITLDGQNGVAVWHPDGNHIAFTALRDGSFNIFSKSVDTSEPERRVTESANTQFPTSWSPDGEKLAYVEFDPDTGLDIWIWRARGKAEPFEKSTFNESAAVFSHDGRFLAFVSNETGEDQVYVRPLDGSSGKRAVSTSGGREPVWGRDGGELFYRDEEWMMAVPFETEGSFEPGAPRPLFEAPFDEAGAPYANYDVSEDGKEFVMVRTDEGREAKRLVVVVNWLAELREQVPVPR
jgi:serine/threonine-protein kinase